MPPDWLGSLAYVACLPLMYACFIFISTAGFTIFSILLTDIIAFTIIYSNIKSQNINNCKIKLVFGMFTVCQFLCVLSFSVGLPQPTPTLLTTYQVQKNLNHLSLFKRTTQSTVHKHINHCSFVTKTAKTWS